MAHQNCEIGRCKKASAAERHPAETRRAQDVPSSDQVPSGDLSITINRITSSTFSRTSTKPFRSCSLDRAHVAAPIPAAVVTNTIWFAFTRTISPSGRCRPSQPVVAAPLDDETAFPVPPMWQSRANASRLGSINAHASSATTAAAAFVGMFCFVILGPPARKCWNHHRPSTLMRVCDYAHGPSWPATSMQHPAIEVAVATSLRANSHERRGRCGSAATGSRDHCVAAKCHFRNEVMK